MAGDENIFDRLGVKGSSLDRVRFAPGVVGKSAVVALAVLVLLTAGVWHLKDDHLIVAVCVVGVAFAGVVLRRMFKFAEEHPGEALLEGAEFLRHRQLEMGTKDLPTLPEDAQVPPPTVIEDKRS